MLEWLDIMVDNVVVVVVVIPKLNTKNHGIHSQGTPVLRPQTKPRD
jgi:hypothetical protein